MNIKIVKAGAADIPGILEVRKQTWLDTYPNRKYRISRRIIMSMDFTGPKRVRREWKKIKDRSVKAFVAKAGKIVVGYGTAQRQYPENYIGSLYVLPGYQRLGIGSKIMAKLMAWLGDSRPIMLKVAVYNKRAIRFYKRFGFIVTDPKAFGPKLPNGRRFPSVEMKCLPGFHAKAKNAKI